MSLQQILFFLCALCALVHGRQMASMNLQQAKAAMFQHRACDSVIMSFDYELVGTTQCSGQRCNFPQQGCMLNKATAWLKRSNDMRCQNIPSTCVQAVESSSSSNSGSFGGNNNFNTRPTPRPATRFTTPRTSGLNRGSGSSGSSVSGGGDCNSAFSRGRPCGARGARGGSNLKQTFYYDPNTRVCKMGFYLGCGGNGNRYSSRQTCEQQCKTGSSGSSSSSSNNNNSGFGGGRTFPGRSGGGRGGTFRSSGGSSSSSTSSKPSECLQPKLANSGGCNGRFARRFYYNQSTRKCELFWYKCGGNSNNFNTKSACAARCE